MRQAAGAAAAGADPDDGRHREEGGLPKAVGWRVRPRHVDHATGAVSVFLCLVCADLLTSQDCLTARFKHVPVSIAHGHGALA